MPSTLIYPTAFALVLTATPLIAHAAQGSFSGREKVTVTNCGVHDGVINGAWSVTNSAVESGRYTLQGRTDRGRFTGEGMVDGTSATQTVSGRDDNGTTWSAKSRSEFDGDRLRVTATGAVNGTSCRFTTEVEAQRDPPTQR